MLFRKFAVDFCDKYQMPPLSLNEEATQLLKNAYWRGNVRQLKNIAEQISVIEMDHQINAETLKRYLPQEEQQHGLVIRTKTQQNTTDYSNEIGMLYNMLIQTQKELRELKQQIANNTPIELPSEHSTHTFIQAPTTQDEWEEVEGITEEPNTPIVEDTYSKPIATPTSIKDAQLELIQRTLKECDGNRKEAAAKLGISERTLYRKIKEYGL
jgi:DNA-binding NtrC family response regulator